MGMTAALAAFFGVALGGDSLDLFLRSRLYNFWDCLHLALLRDPGSLIFRCPPFAGLWGALGVTASLNQQSTNLNFKQLYQATCIEVHSKQNTEHCAITAHA